MTPRDQAFVDTFFALELEAGSFDHEAHVRLAFLLLESMPREDAGHRFRAGLKAFAGHHGVPGKYHETITSFALELVADRMEAGEAWGDFRAANADLFDDFRGLLLRHYSTARIDSDEARTTWVAPDREPLASAAVVDALSC